MEQQAAVIEIDRYRVPTDRAYHAHDHTWVRVEGNRWRIGMDALGQETAGDLAQLFLVPPGHALERGDEMGSLEAQKFVGALRAPVSGTVVEINQAVLDDPRIIQSDPYEAGWLLVVEPSPHADEDLAGLVTGEAIRPWFAAALAEYRREGSVAE